MTARTFIKRACAIGAFGLLGYVIAIYIVTSDAEILQRGLLGTLFQ